jgi:hypothetical protein
MRKIALLCVLGLCVFALESNEGDAVIESKPCTDFDVFSTQNALMTQITQAKKNGDWTTYHRLLEEYEYQLPVQEHDVPDVIQLKPVDDYPMMRWNGDVVIYSGIVNYNSWAMSSDIDDEAISVDLHRGDTLRAAVACEDSALRVFASYDNGMTWSFTNGFYQSGFAAVEPEIVPGGNNGYYHVFCRFTSGNGNVYSVTYDASGSVVHSAWIESSDDTVHNYSVCSDRADYSTGYWLYCAYHQGLGGAGLDGIFFSRSMNQGETWEPPGQLQFAGSGFPDLCYSSDEYVYEAYMYQQGNDKGINTRRSDDFGDTWFGSVNVQEDTSSKMGPQIAASHDGTNDAWVIWPKRNDANPNNDYGLQWAWSMDSGATWSGIGWPGSTVDYQDVLPSISVHNGSHDSLYVPYVTFVKGYYDWSNPITFTFYWRTSDSSWSTAESYNDSTPEYTRPAQTWEAPGIPAMAYVGDGGVNVYYDAWSTCVEEEQEHVVSNVLVSTVRPNPFSRKTSIEYTLNRRENVSIKVYSALGQEVATLYSGIKENGIHVLTWSGVDNNNAQLPKGVYFLKIKTASVETTRKIVIE